MVKRPALLVATLQVAHALMVGQMHSKRTWPDLPIGRTYPTHKLSVSSRLCFVSRTVRVCVPFLLCVCLAVLLKLTEPAKPVEMPRLYCNTLSARQFIDGVMQHVSAVLNRCNGLDGGCRGQFCAAPPWARQASPSLCPVLRNSGAPGIVGVHRCVCGALLL